MKQVTEHQKRYAELVRKAMHEHGVIKPTPGGIKVMSDDAEIIAACFEQAKRELMKELGP